ncbi:hypothetical protein [Luteolibacter soli]|uniref:DUF3592 domain-containing protein n=1 Tax=Luteolibacter soli TaxID=3135280 RepID=A0ABU9ASP0_9BACT
MLRAFFRSRICWLGIPGFLFFLWAWQESGHYDTGAEIRIENRGRVYVRQRGGEVMWYWFWNSPEMDRGSTRHHPLFKVVRRETPEDTLPALGWFGFWFPKPFHHTHQVYVDLPGRGCSVFIVSHWLLLIAYSASWGAFFLWRQRRKKRLSSPTSS